MIGYFNEKYLNKEEIRISPDDRGFLFADGLYEEIRSYRGILFRAKDHIDRLNCGAAALCLEPGDFSYLEAVAATLLEKNELKGDAIVYFQITRGVAPRDHGFPDPAVAPTVYGTAALHDPTISMGSRENGIQVITVPDQRGARCDIRTTGLTANVLARQKAVENKAEEALFVRDGMVLDGTHSNFFAVMDGRLVTAPAADDIHHGITRQVVLELARAKGVAVHQAPIPVTELPGMTEAFITGTTTEITPVISIDGITVGDGTPGPVTRALQDGYTDLIINLQ